jgi:hypothetical protein
MTRPERAGFVLAFVVFMLFAISVAAATGYLVVNTEFAMAKQATDGAEALAVARAGLERFVAEQIGVVPDTVMYALGDGVAVVTTRKLFEEDSLNHLYYIRSEGTVADIFAPNTPARRVVGGYAINRRRPIPEDAAMIVSATTVRVEGSGRADGQDLHGSSCMAPGPPGIGGLVTMVDFQEEYGNNVQGFPQHAAWPGGAAQIVGAIRTRWDVLSDPDFPVDYDGTWPNYAALPADSFPIVRHTGWLTTGTQGRGVLIVDGVFDPQSGFSWEGIILAGHVDDAIQGQVSGMLIGGLEADNMYGFVTSEADVSYASCFVRYANESLSYMELVENALFESY